jgi:hypothetical protein
MVSLDRSAPAAALRIQECLNPFGGTLFITERDAMQQGRCAAVRSWYSLGSYLSEVECEHLAIRIPQSNVRAHEGTGEPEAAQMRCAPGGRRQVLTLEDSSLCAQWTCEDDCVNRQHPPLAAHAVDPSVAIHSETRHRSIGLEIDIRLQACAD